VEGTERRFHDAMIALCERACERGATSATRLLRLIDDLGSVAAARHHLDFSSRAHHHPAGDLPSEISIEALVLDPEWGCLFTEEERALARSRLERPRQP
jgi:hypothetical protein